MKEERKKKKEGEWESYGEWIEKLQQKAGKKNNWGEKIRGRKGAVSGLFIIFDAEKDRRAPCRTRPVSDSTRQIKKLQYVNGSTVSVLVTDSSLTQNMCMEDSLGGQSCSVDHFLQGSQVWPSGLSGSFFLGQTLPLASGAAELGTKTPFSTFYSPSLSAYLDLSEVGLQATLTTQQKSAPTWHSRIDWTNGYETFVFDCLTVYTRKLFFLPMLIDTSRLTQINKTLRYK